MPFTLHPSGYAVFWNRTSAENLKPGTGGKITYTSYRSRRGVFFDRVTALWAIHKKVRLWTFTVPYQQTDFENTDKFYAACFSKLLENYRKRGLIKSYVYVAEAQQRGNIHFHLAVNRDFIPVKEFNDYWCALIGQSDKAVHNVAVTYSKKEDEIIPERLPAYMAKYMNKDHAKGVGPRIIYARSFNSSRDLCKWKPVQLNLSDMPFDIPHRIREKQLVNEHGETFIHTEYYFETAAIVKRFGMVVGEWGCFPVNDNSGLTGMPVAKPITEPDTGPSIVPTCHSWTKGRGGLTAVHSPRVLTNWKD